MRSFLISLILFALVLGGIFLNSRYLSRLSEEMYDTLEAIPAFSEEASDEIRVAGTERLARLWEKHRKTVSFTVLTHTVEGIDDRLGALQAALRYRDAVEFDTAREHLLRIIGDLVCYETVRLGSIF